MDLEGKIMGYSKKAVYTALTMVVVAGVMFYAGAKYEKNKLMSRGISSGTNKTKSGTKAKKSKDNTQNTPTDNSTTNSAPQGNTVPSTGVNAPNNTEKPTTNNTTSPSSNATSPTAPVN